MFTFIAVCLIVFIIGIGVGFVLSKAIAPSTEQTDLEQRIQEVQEELSHYQQSVAKHFINTSDRISHFSQSYASLFEQLSRDAALLTNPEISQKILANITSQNSLPTENSSYEINLSPPKDYAPKVPGQAGMLSEEFGLKDESDSSLVRADYELRQPIAPVSEAEEKTKNRDFVLRTE